MQNDFDNVGQKARKLLYMKYGQFVKILCLRNFGNKNVSY
jgi:hypothetical protein